MGESLTNGKHEEVVKDNANMEEENEPSRRQRKKYLEILSFTCSTVGINLIIACFCGVTNIFGFKSPDMILRWAFAFLFASVLLGFLAMISSITGYDVLQIFFYVAPKYSLLCGFLKTLCSPRNECTERSANMSSVDSKLELNPFEKSKIFNAKESCQLPLKSLGDSLKIKPKDSGFFKDTKRQCTFLSQKKNILPEGTSHVNVTRSSRECTDNSKNIPSQLYKNQFSYPTFAETNINQGIQDYHGNSLPSVVKNYGLSTKTSVETLAFSQRENNRPMLKEYNQESPISRSSFVAPEICDNGMSQMECAKSSGKSIALSQRKNNQSKGKALLQVRKRLNTLSLGHCFTIEDSSRLTNGSRLLSFDVQRNHETAHFTRTVQERSFMTEICTNKKPFHVQIRSREVYEKWHPLEINSCKIRNTDIEARCDFNLSERFTSFTNTCQRTSKDQVSDVILKLDQMNILS